KYEPLVSYSIYAGPGFSIRLGDRSVLLLSDPSDDCVLGSDWSRDLYFRDPVSPAFGRRNPRTDRRQYEAGDHVDGDTAADLARDLRVGRKALLPDVYAPKGSARNLHYGKTVDVACATSGRPARDQHTACPCRPPRQTHHDQ